MSEIRCRAKAPGGVCNRFLGEIVGPNILIFCPACRQRHEIPITALIEHLREYLAEVEEQTETLRRKDGGQGFLL